MKSDIKSNFDITEGLASCTVTDTTAVSASVNGAEGASAAFLVLASAVATSLDGKLQFSADNSTFVDAADARNDRAITQLSAAGMAQINVVVWEKPYARVQLTAVGASTCSVVNILGPKFSIAAE